MRIIFDVNGTLEGGRDPVMMRAMLRRFHEAGCQVWIWSNSNIMVYDFLEKYEWIKEIVGPNWLSKVSTYQLKDRYEMEPFDLAIDDDPNEKYLAAKKVVFVWEAVKLGAEEFVKKVLAETNE